MKAILIDQDKSLRWGDAATPVPSPGEVLIKVHATAINRADLIQRRGGYPPPPGASPILGLECAGEVAGLGAGVGGWEAGDRVCALLAGGGYAEYAVAPAGCVRRLPRGFSFVHGAALPEVFATAWMNLFMEAGLKPGESAILHAGASGVGTAAIQLCHSFGNPCYVTAGSAAKIAVCMELGAAGGSDRKAGSFFEAASHFAGARGVDVILDPVGGAYFTDNLRLLAMNGRLVLIGLMGGSKSEVDLGLLMAKRARLIGSTLRARPNAEKAAVMQQLEENVWPRLEAGEIRPIVDTTFDIRDAGEAQDLIASDKTVGKVVLLVN